MAYSGIKTGAASVPNEHSQIIVNLKVDEKQDYKPAKKHSSCVGDFLLGW